MFKNNDSEAVSKIKNHPYMWQAQFFIAETGLGLPVLMGTGLDEKPLEDLKCLTRPSDELFIDEESVAGVRTYLEFTERIGVYDSGYIDEIFRPSSLENLCDFDLGFFPSDGNLTTAKKTQTSELGYRTHIGPEGIESLPSITLEFNGSYRYGKIKIRQR